MRRAASIFTAVAAWMFLAAAAPPPLSVVEYRLSPVLDHGELKALAVTVRFRADPSGRTRITLPDQDAGKSVLWRYLADLEVKGAEEVEGEGDAARIIHSKPGAPLTVAYRVVSAFDHVPSAHEGDNYRPIVLPTWFWAYGESLFLQVDGRPRATFTWSGAPLGFPFASDLEYGGGRPRKIEDVIPSVAVGGSALRLYRRALGGSSIRVAILGDLQMGDATFVGASQRVIGAERGFWNDRPSPFLVVLAALKREPGTTQIQGEGRSGAFAIQTNEDVSIDHLREIIAHEYFHHWNPIRLGGFAPDDRQASEYWFSEGFTDFYARRLMLRARLMSPEAFADSWNNMLKAYAQSPVRTAPNDRITKDFWHDEAVGKLPYQRGAMLAAIWNARLRNTGRGGLDGLVHTQERLASRTPGTTAAHLFAEAARTRGLDFAEDIARYVERGDPIALGPSDFGPCFSVQTAQVPEFERGWDLAATRAADQVIKGLPEDSPAYAAGLRNEMKVLEYVSGEPGDATVPYVMRVRSADGQEQTIRFSPAGKTLFTLQRLVVNPGVAANAGAACVF